MRTIGLLCLVAASALAVPAQNVDIDTAICIFPLVATQSKGGNPTPMLTDILPYLRKEKPLDNEKRKMFLAAGGIALAQSTKMIDEILPMLAREGKSTYEQLMALMLASNQYCIQKDAPCESNDDFLLPFMTMGSDRGCYGRHIHANFRTTTTDECVCDDQDNVLLWISLLNKVPRDPGQASNRAGFTNSVPNQIPVALMMLLAETPCEGKMRNSDYRCKCSVVTEGNEGLLMHLLVDEPNAEKILNPLAKSKLQEYSREPTTRGLNIAPLLLAQSGLDPSLLSIFGNDGASTNEKLMQFMLANKGLDSATTQLILSGGFSDDSNKVALINYMANRGLVSADAVPFILGVDKGSTFFLQSLLQSGAIDPVMGNLLLAKQTGAPQDQVFDIISNLLTGQTTDLESFGRPYIPQLPEGIFPGSKLYFAHFETLGINTCALHDLRNRFDCGFHGISAAQCEVRPYCCYNPIFTTDEDVANMTAGVITSAIAVPWCYYNIFFIYYNSFALTVRKPGQFASPSSCEPLFKYGLNIDASIYYIYAQSAASSSINNLINLRVECGFPGITEFHCIAIRGCCWDKYAPFRVPQCYNANGGSTFDIDLNTIPVAYQPRNLTCSVNYFQFPILYYRRVACMPTWDMYVRGGSDPLKIPDMYECVRELGCCWEEDDTVAQKYPETPRCYQREDGSYAVQANNIGQITDLFTRSGEINENIYPRATS